MRKTRSCLPGLRVHWSALPVALLVIWELAGGLLPGAAPGYSTAAYWLIASVVTAAFFAGLVVHELAHAVVARRHGQRVRGITLWLFGGVADLEGDAASPGAEFRMAVAGPLASLGVAAVLAGSGWLLGVGGSASLLVVAVAWLARINVLLAVFNLLPAFPLDGGRVLRAALWRFTGDRRKATVRAAWAGRVQGGAVAALGVAGLLFFGWGFSGLWLAVIGVFIAAAAGQQLARVETSIALQGFSVVAVILTPPVVAPDHISVDDLAARWMRPHRLALCPLADAAGLVTGVVTLESIRQLPAGAWPVTPAWRIAVPLTDVVTCRCDEPLTAVADRLAGSSLRAALVFDGAQLAGLLAPDDIRYATRWGRTQRSAGPSTAPRPAAWHLGARSGPGIASGPAGE